jgi:ribonuclease T1
MGFPESTPANRSNRQLPRWTTIAFYLSILLLVTWLQYSPAGDRAAKNPFPPNAPATHDRDRPVDTHEAAEATSRDSTIDERSQGAPQESPPSQTSRRSASASQPSSGRDDALIIRNVTVLDEDRRVVYRGDVNLAPTLKRIESGARLRFSHDGIVFENRERRLPAKPSGYYHEFVAPTPGDNGPGAQRVILGAGGEVFYSSDHYRTFRRIR